MNSYETIENPLDLDTTFGTQCGTVCTCLCVGGCDMSHITPVQTAWVNKKQKHLSTLSTVIMGVMVMD